MTEDTCPAGWVLDRTDAAYSGGVCKPVCQQNQRRPGREDDGFCNEEERDCADGYDTSYYGAGAPDSGPFTYFCRPGSSRIKDAFYKAK